MTSSRGAILWIAAGLVVPAGIGCADRTPPPPQVAVPRDASEGPLRRSDPVKPMPYEVDDRDDMPRHRPMDRGGAAGEIPPPPFEDPTLVDQEIPEQAAFVRAYNDVGRPAMVIEGKNQTEVADRPIAMMLADWMRADGAVTMVVARGERAQPDVVIELATDDGGGKRGAVNLSARAFNARDNVLLAQAMVDMPTPADRQAINRYTRFLARKLMTDMTRSWESLPEAPPTTAPAR